MQNVRFVASFTVAMLFSCSGLVASTPDAGGGTESTGGGGGAAIHPNPAAATGAPSATLFNGLRTVLDPDFVHPEGAVAASAATMPPALNSTLPSMPDVRATILRDGVLLSFANVAQAADYRAYLVRPGVTFTGAQPRGAVVACAGFRQHTYPSPLVEAHHTRELLQVVELPGLQSAGAVTVVIEALTSPCPYVGLPAHTDAQVTMGSTNGVNNPHLADPLTYAYVGVPRTVFRSFETQTAQYGNVLLNGQGATIDFDARQTVATLGATVPPNDPTFPSDPTVLARSAVSVVMPDLTTLAASDVGPHALVEDFTDDHVVAASAIGQNPDYATYNGFALDPLFQLGNWQFWGRFMEGADLPGVAIPTLAQRYGALQVFTKLGRLFTGFGDSGQDVGGTLAFASQVAPVVQLDQETYVHSTFRVNTTATHRRYWWWALCGGATATELYDSTTKTYKLRPLVFETTFEPGGNNPSVPEGHTLLSSNLSDDAVGLAKECLSFTEEGRPEDGFATDGHAQTSESLRAQLHPANKSHGMIALGNARSEKSVLNGIGADGFRYRVDAAGNRVAAALAPHDQIAPLTRFDLYVRKDRLVVFVDQVQTFCVDLHARPLTMDYAMIVYGDLVYHSSVEWQELSNSADSRAPQMYQQLLNQPIATSRAWDFIGHSDGAALPATFDATLCRPPETTMVQ
jgi:hypothetical protein